MKSPTYHNQQEQSSVSSRRSFLNHSGMAVLATSLSGFTPANEMPSEKNMFVHQVYFWLKNPGNKEDLQKLIEGLEKLSKVKTIRSFHIGKPAGTSRDVVDASYAISWLTIFKNAADQDSYQVDPIHLNFISECSHVWNKVVVYDSIDAT